MNGSAGKRTLLRAAWVAPMMRPLVRDGGVVIEGGTIEDVGTFAGLRHGYPTAAVEDLGDVLLTPGLVNAHTHLELTDVPAGVAAAAAG